MRGPIVDVVAVRLAAVISLVLGNPEANASVNGMGGVLTPLVSGSVLFVRLLSLPMLFQFSVRVPVY